MFYLLYHLLRERGKARRVTWRKRSRRSDRACTIQRRMPTPLRPITRCSTVWWPSTLLLSRRMRTCSTSPRKKPLTALERLTHATSKNRSSCDATGGDCAGCPGAVSARCHQRGSWICPLLLHLSQAVAYSVANWPRPRKPGKGSGRNAPNARLFLLAHGTNPCPSMRGNGRSAPALPFS